MHRTAAAHWLRSIKATQVSLQNQSSQKAHILSFKTFSKKQKKLSVPTTLLAPLQVPSPVHLLFESEFLEGKVLEIEPVYTLLNAIFQLCVSLGFGLSLKDSNSVSTGRKLLAFPSCFTAAVLGHLNKEMSSIYQVFSLKELCHPMKGDQVIS